MKKVNVDLQPGVRRHKRDEIPHLLEEGAVGAVLEILVKDKDGNVKERRIQKSESFVRQFLEILWTLAWPLNYLEAYVLRDTGNTLRPIMATYEDFDTTALAGDITHGTVVGTDNTAPDIDQYALGAIIAHGVGVGQLQYGAVTYGAPTNDATTSQFTITRDFSNASGGAIVVNEIGLYVKGYIYADTYYFMTIRDVVAGGVTINNGETLTINYRIQATV